MEGITENSPPILLAIANDQERWRDYTGANECPQDLRFPSVEGGSPAHYTKFQLPYVIRSHVDQSSLQ